MNEVYLRFSETHPAPGRPLTDKAYSLIRARIINGSLAPGTEVSEPSLALWLEMSKTPVREALVRLCREGLMEAFPRRGYRVTPITIKDINDLFYLRGGLEGMAVEQAAKNLTDEAIENLFKLAKETWNAISPEDYVAKNASFHTEISKWSENPRLIALIAGTLEECARLFVMGLQTRDTNPETRDDHLRIVELLRRRDGAGARLAVIEHNNNTRVGLLAALVNGDEGNVQL